MLQRRWRLQCRTRRSAAADYWTLYSSERARARLDDSIESRKAWNGPCNKRFCLSLRLRFRIRLVSHIRVTRPVVFLIGHVVNSATRPTCWQSIKLYFIFHDNGAGIIDTWETIILIRIRIYLWHSFVLCTICTTFLTLYRIRTTIFVTACQKYFALYLASRKHIELVSNNLIV